MAGTVLYGQVFGDEGGRPAVALHGVKGHSGRWRRLAACLPQLRMYAYDLRGHGHSEWSPPWSLDQHAADVLATMDAAGVARADLFGHSYGAAVAVQVARQAPERVARLVLLDPAIGLPAPVAGARADAERHARVFDDQQQARQARARAWPGVTDPEVVEEEVAAHLAKGEDGRWRWRYAPAAVVTAFSEMARPALPPPDGVPVLLVKAGRVDVVQPELVAAYRSAGAALTVVELDCYHEVPLECPARVAEFVREFAPHQR